MSKPILGIFGDSFADHSDRYRNTTMPWYEYLNDQYQILKFSHVGSSLFYSYDKFLENESQCDKILFVVTNPGRLYLRNFDFPKVKGIANIRLLTSVSPKDFIEKTLRDSDLDENTRKNIITIFTAAEKFFTYVQNDQQEICFHHLMLRDIIIRRSDTILVPAFKNSLENQSYPTMFDIQMKENKHWNLPEHHTFYDIRHCHMTAENNLIFYKNVLKWLDGAPVEINLDDYVTPDNKEFYIRDINE